MNGKWLKWIGIVILALALVIAGCSGKSTSSGSSGGQQAGGQSNGPGSIADAAHASGCASQAMAFIKPWPGFSIFGGSFCADSASRLTV
jgi:hypothetical protein